MGDQTLVSHYLGKCHNRYNTKDTDCCYIHPSKEKAYPHAFQVQRSHGPPNVTVGRISDG